MGARARRKRKPIILVLYYLRSVRLIRRHRVFSPFAEYKMKYCLCITSVEIRGDPITERNP